MAMKFVTACLVVAKLTQLVGACDTMKITSGMPNCQMKLANGGGDLCSRYNTYNKCMEDLLSGCPASSRQAFATAMKSATAAYSSQLDKCSSSSGSGSENEKEKPSVSGSSSGNIDGAKSCSSSDLHTKSSSCIQKMTAAAAGGNTCGAWHTYECCLKESFASCGNDIQGQISTMMSTMKTQYDAILPGLAKCDSATCSSSESGPSPTPAQVETTLMASIELSDPLTFTLEKYLEAVKKATGVEELPEAVVKAFEIIVKYALPDATEMSKAKTAIAKANGVAEDEVQVAQSGARRLGAGRRLSDDVVVTITVLDKTKAAAVQKSAANITTLGSELGGAVAIKAAPVTTAKVETKVKSAPSAASQLKSQIESAGSDIGGTIKAEVKVAAPQPSSSGASSTFSVALAAVAILLRAAF